MVELKPVRGSLQVRVLKHLPAREGWIPQILQEGLLLPAREAEKPRFSASSVSTQVCRLRVPSSIVHSCA